MHSHGYSGAFDRLETPIHAQKILTERFLTDASRALYPYTVRLTV